jgi:hypothetical protein
MDGAEYVFHGALSQRHRDWLPVQALLHRSSKFFSREIWLHGSDENR